MDQKGINPIDMLFGIYKRAIDKYDLLQTDQPEEESKDKRKPFGPVIDNGHNYLAQALGAAQRLASYRYPTLSAVAIEDLNKESIDSKPMTTREALKIMQADPFAPPEIKALDISKLPEIDPILPAGNNGQPDKPS